MGGRSCCPAWLTTSQKRVVGFYRKLSLPLVKLLKVKLSCNLLVHFLGAFSYHGDWKIGSQKPKRKAPMCSTCQFLKCKHSHHAQLQAITIISLNTEWARKRCAQLALACWDVPALAHQCPRNVLWHKGWEKSSFFFSLMAPQMANSFFFT